MNNDGRQDVQPSTARATGSSPRNYSFLLQMSRRLGNVATQSSFIQDVRSFMSHEITYNTPSLWWDTSVAMIRGDRPTAPSQPSKEDEAAKSNDGQST